MIIRQHNSKYKLIYIRYFYFIFIERFTKDNNSIFCYFPFKYGKSCSDWSNAAVPKTNPYFFFFGPNHLFLLSGLFCFKINIDNVYTVMFWFTKQATYLKLNSTQKGIVSRISLSPLISLQPLYKPQTS